jgi:hypothetical protein
MVITRTSSLWIPLVLASCGGNALNIGSTDGSSGPVWNGSIDGVQLQDGSNRLSMTLSPATDGRVSGTLLLGDGALLQPAKDPNRGYPPGAMFSNGLVPLGFFEGFPYPMADGSSTGSKLTFRVAEFDLWGQWCSLQTKTYLESTPASRTADGGAVYLCVPSEPSSVVDLPPACSATDPATGNAIPVDCGKLGLCFHSAGPCDCTATGCSEMVTTDQAYINFDLVISGSHADGTISGWFGDHAVHFVRAP